MKKVSYETYVELGKHITVASEEILKAYVMADKELGRKNPLTVMLSKLCGFGGLFSQIRCEGDDQICRDYPELPNEKLLPVFYWTPELQREVFGRELEKYDAPIDPVHKCTGA